jgi:hypothetical protein
MWQKKFIPSKTDSLFLLEISEVSSCPIPIPGRKTIRDIIKKLLIL